MVIHTTLEITFKGWNMGKARAIMWFSHSLNPLP
jgi:hypothetical protein